VERFDRRDPEPPFMGQAKLKQSSNLETYISEFIKLSVMVPNLSVARRVYMFIDGLTNPLHGLVKSTNPTTLQDVIERDIYLQDSLPKAKEKFHPKQTFPSKGKHEKAPLSKESLGRVPLSDDV